MMKPLIVFLSSFRRAMPICIIFIFIFFIFIHFI